MLLLLFWVPFVGPSAKRFKSQRRSDTCWDADRLDLGRVGIMPEPSRLCTAAAKRSDLLKWADGRACFGVVPKLVMDDWRIDVNSCR